MVTHVTKMIERERQTWTHPFQNAIWKSTRLFVKYFIEILHCPSQSKVPMDELARACAEHENGMHIVAGPDGDNNFETIVQHCCKVYMSRGIRSPGPVFIDISNISQCESSLRGVLSAAEQIKNGHLFDMRHRYKSWWVDSPQIWIFCDTFPCVPEVADMIRVDTKWRLWEIDDRNDIARVKQ